MLKLIGVAAIATAALAPATRPPMTGSMQAAALAPAPVAPANPRPVPAQGLLLRKDTPIRLMVMTEVSTKVDMAGHRFRLAVDEPVMIDGHVAIAEGTPAWGEVTGADRSGNLGKAGTLSARLLFIDLAGTHLAINGETQAKGHSAGGETALAVLGLGPLGLLAKGNNAKIKAGERMTGFVTEDTLLQPAPADAKPF